MTQLVTPEQAHLPQGLATCSICLRVWRGSEWIDAEQAIIELRTFAHGEPVRLAPGLCDDCREELAERRGLASPVAV